MISFPAFCDEFLKIAAKVPVVHGTSGAWDELKPGQGSSVLKNDPNPRAVYVAMKGRKKMPSIERFAEEASRAKGGTPQVAHAKVDTKKGWLPANLTSWGKQHIGDVDDAKDLAKSLDTIPDKKARGAVWRKLHQGVGSWRNEDLSKSLKPKFYKAVKQVAEAAGKAA